MPFGSFSGKFPLLSAPAVVASAHAKHDFPAREGPAKRTTFNFLSLPLKVPPISADANLVSVLPGIPV